jgi:hypothetical protein
MANSFWSQFQIHWCTLIHGEPMWPIHGYYRCSTCLRKHPVPWVRNPGLPAEPIGDVRSSTAGVGAFGAPEVAYAGRRRRNSL